MQHKISPYNPQHTEALSLLEVETDEITVSDIRENEDYITLRSPASPFLLWSSQIYSSIKDLVNLHNEDCRPINRVCNVMLCEKIFATVYANSASLVQGSCI